MSSLIEPGDYVLVVHRRLFERDENRFFVGRIDAIESGVIRVTGYSYVRDMLVGHSRRKDDLRTKLLSLTSGTLLVYVLPRILELSNVELRSEESELWLTDGGEFSMNVSEWTHRAH